MENKNRAKGIQREETINTNTGIEKRRHKQQGGSELNNLRKQMEIKNDRM